MTGVLKHIIIAAGLLLPCTNAIAGDSVDISGHTKYRLLHTRYPADSIYSRYIGDQGSDQNIDLRLKLNWEPGSTWRMQADYQLIALSGDTLEASRVMPATLYPDQPLQNDDYRLFDLTRVLHERDDRALMHRFDRFYIDHTSRKTVVRFGRQAITWGNGLIYTPMDFFNPFDPSAIDKEYKTGDDMLYGQYLLDNGNDVQIVRVFRRNAQHTLSNHVATAAAKYHGLTDSSEYDILLAQHYGDTILGLGGNTALGGAVWHGDLTITKTIDDKITSLVTGLSYSWIWGETNYSGVVEYFYNGFGIGNGNYTESLAQKPALLKRIQRGELYTLGKQYLAASATIEVTPLLNLTPTLYHNLSDGSSLVQFLSQYSLSQNTQLLAAVDIPTGPGGTEYGGIDTGTDGLKLNYDYRFSLQLAWYF